MSWKKGKPSSRYAKEEEYEDEGAGFDEEGGDDQLALYDQDSKGSSWGKGKDKGGWSKGSSWKGGGGGNGWGGGGKWGGGGGKWGSKGGKDDMSMGMGMQAMEAMMKGFKGKGGWQMMEAMMQEFEAWESGAKGGKGYGKKEPKPMRKKATYIPTEEDLEKVHEGPVDPNSGMAWYKTSMCKFAKWGSCAKGDECFYAHSAEEMRQPPDALLDCQYSSVPGLDKACLTALEPFAHLDNQWTLEEMQRKVAGFIDKCADKCSGDERLNQRGSVWSAQVLVEEFVELTMTKVQGGCYEKTWVSEVDWTIPLMVACKHLFQGSKLFTRTLAPVLKKQIEEALFRWAEETRIEKAMRDGLAVTGLPEEYHKKAKQHLANCYDKAHLTAEYGSHIASTPQLGYLEDFLGAWMRDFVSRAWDVLQNGVGAEDDVQIYFLTTLFTQLADPETRCYPNDLAELLQHLPPANWPFISEEVAAIYAENASAASRPATKKRKTGGGGAGMGGMQHGMGSLQAGLMQQQGLTQQQMMMQQSVMTGGPGSGMQMHPGMNQQMWGGMGGGDAHYSM